MVSGFLRGLLVISLQSSQSFARRCHKSHTILPGLSPFRTLPHTMQSTSDLPHRDIFTMITLGSWIGTTLCFSRVHTSSFVLSRVSRPAFPVEGPRATCIHKSRTHAFAPLVLVILFFVNHILVRTPPRHGYSPLWIRRTHHLLPLTLTPKFSSSHTLLSS